ncbi:MAG TPA: CpaF family protein [Firmicutes bacterium]|nr:CpaF family protein [Bacillota bacterium]
MVQRADLVVLVGTADLLGLRSLPPARERTLTGGLDGRRVGWVVNRLGSAGSVPRRQAEEMLTGRCWGFLPEVPGEVTEMITKGAWRCGEAAWSAAVDTLAARLDQVMAALPEIPRRALGSDGAQSSPKPFLSAQAKQEVLRQLVQRLGQLPGLSDSTALRRRVTEEAVAAVEALAEVRRLPKRDVDTIVLQLVDEMLGLGILEELIRDPEVTEVMINGPDRIYVEKAGRILPVARRFSSPDEITRLVERIIGPLGRRIDESSPMVDARLPDGSRLNAVIPPLALDGPLVTIRRFGVTARTMADLVAAGTVTESLARRLQEAVVEKRSILLSGGTGTGKTTLLNALSGFIPEGERIITIEDAAELRLQQEHVVRLEARPPNLEGQGAITIRDLVRNALRMRPDRIIVGEVRGPEALDMLQAMNTGHNGSMATIHANSARDALSRLETMVLMANVALPLAVVREQIAAAIDLVVHLERGTDGRRRVTEVLWREAKGGGDSLERVGA